MNATKAIEDVNEKKLQQDANTSKIQQVINELDTFSDQHGEETPLASNVDKETEQHPPASTQLEPSNEATLAHMKVVLYSTSSSNLKILHLSTTLLLLL